MAVDEPETQEDQTSAEEQETSQEPQGYSQEQVNKLMEKVRSDSLAELGRVRKAAEDSIRKATTEATKTYQELIRQRETEELEAARDEPDKVAVIRERQARRAKDAELTEVQIKLNDANTRLQELSTREEAVARERTTRETAERLKVNPARLAELAKFTNGSAEAIEEIAKEMPKLNATAPRAIRPDSSDTAGGTPKTKTKIQEDYIGGKINAVQYGEQMKALGLQP